MKRAVLYLRYAQLDQESAYTKVNMQYAAAQKYCMENGIELMGVFGEVTVKHPKEREIFNRALNFCKQSKQKITDFLVMDFSRISRRYYEFDEVKEELQSLGINITPVAPGNPFSVEFIINQLNQIR